jgi:hypothetical protein
MVAITTNGGSSIGYVAETADDSYDTAEWAIAQPGLGERYWVESQSAGEVVRVPSLARTVSVGKGRIGAFGVVDTLVGNTQAAQLQVQFPNPSSGSVHHLVTCRRRWETTNATSIETVTGTSSPVVPARPYADPGNTRDDQPLALYRVTKDDPLPYVVADLRVIGNKGRYEATSKLVLDIPGYVDHPGYVVRIAGTDYLRTVAGTWEVIDSPVQIVAGPVGSYAEGWNADAPGTSYIVRDGKRRATSIELRRQGGTIAVGASGHVNDEVVRTLSDGDKPAFPVRSLPGLYKNGGDFGCTLSINTAGEIKLNHATPNVDIPYTPLPTPTTSDWTLRFYVEWYAA